jgi:hypothetical protein
MHIYDGAPRQNYEEVLRSIGAILDQHGMREIAISQTDDGFFLQGLAVMPGEEKAWNDPTARIAKQTIYLREEDISRFMDEGIARRRRNPQSAGTPRGPAFYETALRVIGGYIDQQQPRDVFFFEQDHQFVMRLLMPTHSGLRHVLVEFTSEEIGSMVKNAAQAHGRKAGG